MGYRLFNFRLFGVFFDSICLLCLVLVVAFIVAIVVRRRFLFFDLNDWLGGSSHETKEDLLDPILCVVDLLPSHKVVIIADCEGVISVVQRRVLINLAFNTVSYFVTLLY